MEPRTRYILYAGAAALAAAAYVLLEEDSAPDASSTDGSTAGTAASITLPELAATSGKDNTTVKRDLFKTVVPAPKQDAIAAAPPPPPPPPPAPPPDRLGDLRVLGLVSRGKRLAILIEQGDEVVTVETGQKFGQDDALAIDGIEANRVIVTDKMANISKTFTLSEE